MPLTELVGVQPTGLPGELTVDAVEGEQQQLAFTPGRTVGERDGRVVHVVIVSAAGPLIAGNLLDWSAVGAKGGRVDADLGREAADYLQSRGIRLDPGLSEREFERIESTFGFEFAPEHRALLAVGVPVGPERFPGSDYPDWPRWRDGSQATLQRRLDWPFVILPTGDEPLTWWHRTWGTPPDDRNEALRAARAHVATWPRLVPIYGHRYLPAAPAPVPAPVLSVHDFDIIFYGSDLISYLHNEFDPWGTTADGGRVPLNFPTEPVPVLPWSELDNGDSIISL
jgi:hypothetical protein